MEITTGKIVDMTEGGEVLIKTALPSIDRAILRDYKTVEVGFPDGRKISPQQRRMCYKLLHAIGEWMGDDIDSTKATMKMDFIANRQRCLARKLFSLADVDMTTAREFNAYLIDFIVHHGVQTDFRIAEECEDIRRYIYACFMAKRCAVCGREGADLHHVDRIGIGGDRKKINHIGRRALPLCRVHHSELHGMSEPKFLKMYHLEPIEIDETIAKKYRLKQERRRFHED